MANVSSFIKQFAAAAALAMFGVLAPASGHAATVFDTGAPSAGQSGNDATAWVQANRFSLEADTSVTGGGIYIAGFGSLGSWDGTFDYWIFQNASGAPGSVVASGAATVKSTMESSTAWCCGGNVYKVAFDFASAIDLMGMTSYWLGIHLSADFARDDIYWAATDGKGVHAESLGGTFTNWDTYGPAHSFYLESASEPAPVPLPAAAPLLASAMAMFGLMGLRRVRRG